jgi:signal peptidase I
MSPTMHSGGVYVINTRYYRSHPVQNGDVVVFRYRGETCTKRVFAVPGQRLLVLRDDDGGADEIIDKSDVAAFRRLERGHRLAGGRLKELTVPPGCCYVLGDNREVSWDSRSFGWLPMETIVGRVSL